MQWVLEAVEADRRPHVRGVSFGARACATTAVADPDPARRAALLRLAAGLAVPDQGAVLVLGHDLAHLRRRRRAQVLRRLAVVLDGPQQALFAGGSAFENVALALRAADEDEALAERALDAVGLGPVAGERPSALTASQRRRLAVARAIAQRPELVLAGGLDEEPDPREAAAMAALLREDARRRGSAVVLFVADAALAGHLADEVVALGPAEGRVPQSCTAAMRR